MKRTSRLAIGTGVTAIVGLVSCNGGVGGIDPTNGGWDDDKGTLSQRERPFGAQDSPQSSEQPPDRVPDRNDNPPVTGGGSGGGTFVCSGIYECVLTGRARTCVTGSDGEQNCSPSQVVTIRVRLPLEEKGGVCFIGEAVLEPNGVILDEDQKAAGTWTRQGNGIYIQAGESSGSCFPSSGPVGIVGSDGSSREGSGASSSSTSSSSSSSSGDISIDPGTGQDGSSSSSGAGG